MTDPRAIPAQKIADSPAPISPSAGRISEAVEMSPARGQNSAACSDQWIADACEVTQPFVLKLRPQFITVINSSSESSEPEPAPERRTGKDGKSYPAKQKPRKPENGSGTLCPTTVRESSQGQARERRGTLCPRTCYRGCLTRESGLSKVHPWRH